MSAVPAIENLEQARRYATQARCEGCQKVSTLSAYEVQKEGLNRGRLFVKCRHCGHFGWLTAATTPDEERDRAEAGASPCPKCGKRRSARRVSKDGANKGRLFLVCADPACDSFEWASPQLGPRPAPAPRSVPTEGERTEEGLLTDIRDNPEDDTTRLIYADWLDEHGQPARADFIRAQVEGAPGAQAILDEHEGAWTSALRPFVVRWRFVRGLIDEVELEAAQFAEHADDVLRAAPTAALCVRVDGWQGVRALVACKQLLDVRRLTLLGERMGGAGARILAESPHIANLMALSLAGQSLGQPGTQALAGSRYLKNLEALDLSDNNLSRSAVPILASSANLPRLRRLVLAGNLLEDSDARALANSPYLQALQELGLSGNAITREGAAALARSPLRARLRRLVL
jgi:uncharacterized protein (TIGR02996 family)